MTRAVKAGLLAAGVVCLLAAPLAYQHRQFLHRVLHRIKHSMVQTEARPAPAASNTLELGGRKYAEVLGYPPYYLAVTQINSVLFVTRLNAGGTNIFHVFSLKTGQDEQITSIADFGRNIGCSVGEFHDYVERADPGEVVVASDAGAGRRTKTVYRLDLLAGLVDTREVFNYDENGRITNTTEGPGF